MKLYISLLLTTFVFVCTQCSPLLEEIEQGETPLWKSEQNGNLNTFQSPKTNVDDKYEHVVSKESEGKQFKKRRITPIMFMNVYNGNNTAEDEDMCASSHEDFPNFFTPEQRRNGAVIICFLVGIYCFTLLAILCDNYFLPCVERICEALNLSRDVAAATFMAMATSAPELFVNIIGTFVTESDIGIGTVVGSSMFNTLGVGALGSLAAANPIQVDWWPVTRDCTIYIISISLLVIMAWDSYIYWYEGMVLFIVYFLYFVIMFNNERISRFVRGLIVKYSSSAGDESKSTDNKNNLTKLERADGPQSNGPRQSIIFYIEEPRKCYTEFNKDCEKVKMEEKEPVEVSSAEKVFTIPKGLRARMGFFFTWPLQFLLFCTIPDPKTRPKLFPVTFIICVMYIGSNSYIVSWMITIIGHTFQISDAVLGLTFLAAGGCLPEAISIIIMSRKGEGRMGVSNALGANSMNILLSLGLPWFVKTLIVGGGDIDKKFLVIESGSIEYTILALTLVAATLFLVLYFNKFYLSKRTGVLLLVVYCIFLCLAIISEILFVQVEDC